MWIGLREPTTDQLEVVADAFGLHPLAVEDAVHAHQRPKLERYDDSLFLVLKTVVYVEHDRLTPTSEVVSTGEIMIFAGRDFAVVVRHGDSRTSESYADSSKPSRSCWPTARPPSYTPSPTRSSTSTWTWSAPSKRMSNRWRPASSHRNAPTTRGVSTSSSGRCWSCGARWCRSRCRCGSWPRRAPGVDPEIGAYLRDVSDHLAQASERITGFAELLDGVLSANLAQLTVRQNTDLRRISAWAAIIAVPTMIVGVYGMNFDHMPELRWTFGYPLVLTVIVIACTLMYRAFRRNDWL